MKYHESPELPEVEVALRAAHRALEVLSGDRVASEEQLTISEVISQLPAVVEEAYQAAAAHLGPLIRWRATPREGWEPLIAVHDFDDEDRNVDEIELLGISSIRKNGSWHEYPLNLAAQAYRREAGWDFTPGCEGIWVLMLAPGSRMGAKEDGTVSYGGHLVGFLIVHDRDEDGMYESVAHIWTASTWRRRGIAQRLLSEAQARFPIVEVEGPYTEDGTALLNACPLERAR